MRTNSRSTEKAAPPSTTAYTAIFQTAQARYVGVEIQNPNNLALQEDKSLAIASNRLEGHKSSRVNSTIDHPPWRASCLTSVIPSTHAASNERTETWSISNKIGHGKDATRLAGPPPSVPLPALPNTRFLPFTSRPVTLLVGGPASPSKETEPVSFFAHEQLLIWISPFFRAALEQPPPNLGSSPHSGFREARTRTITLPEERPEDIAMLLQWAYWRSLWETTTRQLDPSRAASAADDDTATASGLHHALVDPAVRRYRQWCDEKRLLKQTFGAASAEVKAYRARRPRPPAFGPLVRLYVLADRYAVGRGLRYHVCERMRWAGREANCVPDREDVALLYDAVMEAAGVGLKRTVLEMYAGVGAKSVAGLLVSGKAQEAVEEEDGEGMEWHPAFMRDLVCVLVETLEPCRSRKGEGKERGDLWVERDEQARRRLGSFEQRDGSVATAPRRVHSLFH